MNVSAFIKPPGLFYDPDDEYEPDFSEQAYINHLQHCTVLEISGGIDFDQASDKCINFLKTGKI